MKKAILWTMLLAVFAPPAGGQELSSPQEYLRFPVGTDRHLADWKQIGDYLNYLSQTSDRVLLQQLGTTTEGQPLLLLIISQPETLARLDHYQNLQQSLADPRKSADTAEALIQQGKTVLLATCAIHSNEPASAQMALQMAHELAQAQDRDTLEILSNVIFLLVPSLNPDGLNLVNHWYRDTVGTAAEGTLPPRLYHTYAGHDLNRDWFMLTQQETRLAVTQIHNVWHPQIVLDLHEMGIYGPRMFVPPFIDPIDPNVDPLLQAQIVRLGGSLLTGLIGAGKEGIVTHAIYDAYTPARAYQHYHGGVRILVEAAGARLATPVQVKRSELVSGQDYDVHRSRWNFPVPWSGGRWGLPEIIEYQKIALRSALQDAARFRTSWLANFHQIGSRALNKKNPAAFILPATQSDPQSLQDLLEVLRLGQIEIHETQQPFGVDEASLVSPPYGDPNRRDFAEGSHIIRLDQPYGAFAKTLLEIQRYSLSDKNQGTPKRRPYDVTGHSLGIQMGVEGYLVDQLPEINLSIAPPREQVQGGVRGQGPYGLYSHTNNAFARLTNRLLKAGESVYWAPNGFRVGNEGYPVGTLMTHWQPKSPEAENLTHGLPIQLSRVQKRPLVAWEQLRLPAIGLYRSHSPAKDEGWTRWLLEQYGFPYQSLHDQEIRQQDLSGLDVIVIPHQDPGRIEVGLRDPFPPQYRGGLGKEGFSRLRKFARSGGTLIFLGASTEIPLTQWDLDASPSTRRLRPGALDIPGALLRVQVNNRHPIGYGMPEQAAVMYYGGEAFDLKAGLSVVEYSHRQLLLSGWMRGEKHLARKTALAELPIGSGRVILIGFRPHFRGQTRGSFKFLFNSLYYAANRR